LIENPLARNAKLIVPDQPVSLVWDDADDPDPIYRCLANCAACGASTHSWAPTLGWPNCDEDERNCLDQLAEQGCAHTGAMRTYLDLLLLESPA
jgi:hypothetical protein